MPASKSNPELWKKRCSQATKELWDKGKGNGFKKGHVFMGTNISEIMKDRPNPNTGKKYSEERKQKMRDAWKKRKEKGFLPWNKGKKLPPNPNRKTVFVKGHTLTPKGSSHWNWKGGTKSLRKKIQCLAEYKAWRTLVFQRNDYTCQECDKRGGVLQADHIKPFSEIILENDIKTVEDSLKCKELWDLANGRTLCVDCHRKTSSFGLKQMRKLKQTGK